MTARTAAFKSSADFTGSTPGATQDDYYTGQQVIETRVDSAIKYQNLWSPRYIDSLILRDTYSGGSVVTAERVLYLSDANYNVTGLVKYNSGTSDWEVVERYTYTPYGVATFRNASWTDVGSSANANANLFTGRYLDLLTSLYYYRARLYDAAMERFINRDPVQSGPNLYAYCNGNPMITTDPLGMKPAGTKLPPPLTGACTITIFLGHAVWDYKIAKIDDPNVTKFIKRYDTNNQHTVNGGGHYVSIIGCNGGELEGNLRNASPIPGLKGITGNLSAKDFWAKAQAALNAAKAFQDKLCENRKNLKDNGCPEAYDRGAGMQWCDSVTIHVVCDPDTKAFLATGIYKQRMSPGGIEVPSMDFKVPGLPTDESKHICGKTFPAKVCSKTPYFGPTYE